VCAGCPPRPERARRVRARCSRPLLDHYRQTLSEIRQVGYLTYAGRQFRPYVRAAVDQFSPKRLTLTQRLLERVQSRKSGFRLRR